MIWRIEVKLKQGLPDGAAAAVVRDIHDLGINAVTHAAIVNVYLLEGNLTRDDVKRICEELLVDPVVEEYSFAISPKTQRDDHHIIEVAYNIGVMDPVESSTIKGIRDLGIFTIEAVRTAKQYHLFGSITQKESADITERVLMNKLIQHAYFPTVENIPTSLLVKAPAITKFDLITVDLLGADDKQLLNISGQGQLYLNLNEMKAIQAYFKKENRNPTDVELETIAQTWSEHCHHKTFRGIIRYTTNADGKKKTRTITSLLKSTIAKATGELKKKWCVSVFHDNAGVIAFDKDYHVCFKVETHNHPSALEPFGGANTGVGGVIRDILGTGLAAKPLCNTDVFCFAPPDMPFSDLPKGTLHPKRVMKGVVSGVRDYGNKMGIPTVNGAILFDKHFVANPLVFCGTVGLMPKGKEVKKVRKGDLIVALGGRTGRDGIHGATFSSGDLTGDSQTVSSGAVQIGNPIEEKKVLDALLKARDLNLYTAITDLGAGGFSSAIGEMGATTGARVDLDKAPLKYQGLKYHEIWISESQERMALSVSPDKIDQIMALFARENVEAAVLGEFSGSGRLELFYHGVQVANLDMHLLHEGIPKITKEAVYIKPKLKAEKLIKQKDFTQDLCKALNHPNVASKESIIRIYDHEVQGTSVIKPLVGKYNDGPSDAAVIRPRLDSNQGVAISNGINVRYGMIDPLHMAMGCIDEAIRQIIAVGGSLDRIAILDNFCWGNPDKADRLGSLVRCADGCYQAAVGFGTPFISGKDSLYNEYTEKGKSLAIPGTILISAIGIVPDVRKTITMDFKKAGNRIFIVGQTADELGGSIFLANRGQLGTSVPVVNIKRALKTYAAMEKAIGQGLIAACHDCSEGGLAVALSEMAFAGGLGVSARLAKVPFKGRRLVDDVLLFSETHSRFIIEVDPKNEKKLKSIFKGVALAHIGSVEATPEFIVYGLKDTVVINATIDDLKTIWQTPLK